ncbi:MAG: tetratricopeptide repeat protein [Planctomycetaceae bacterium]|nr:tetratricopeptide repeat protein [Planctomycetaceae bacterium]
MSRIWGQTQAGQSWASEHCQTDAAAAFLASGYAALCADTGTSLLEIHQTQPLRAAWLEAGATACSAIGDQSGEAIHQYNQGLVLLAMRRTGEGILCIKKAQRAFCKLGDAAAESAALNGLGIACTAMRKHRQAIRYHWRALRIAEASDNKHDEAVTLEFLGSAYHAAGKREQAIKFLTEAVEELRGQGNQRSEANAVVKLATVYIDEGDMEAARRLSREAVSLIRDTNLGADASLLQSRIAMLLLQIDDSEIDEILAGALDDSRTENNRLAEAMMLLVSSVVMAKQARHSDARRACEEASEIFRSVDFPPGEELAHRMMCRHEDDAVTGRC